MELELIPHPASPAPLIERVLVRMDRLSDLRLALTFIVIGDISALQVAAPVPSERADGLWQATCFEAFLRRPGDVRYAEFNFSPSTQWAAYVFEGYRAGRHDLPTALVPRFDMLAGSDRFELGVVFDLARPGDAPPPGRESVASVGDLLIGLSAVLEMRDRTKSYWALAHPAGSDAPDFHHGDCFAVRLQAPDGT